DIKTFPGLIKESLGDFYPVFKAVVLILKPLNIPQFKVKFQYGETVNLILQRTVFGSELLNTTPAFCKFQPEVIYDFIPLPYLTLQDFNFIFKFTHPVAPPQL